MSPILKRVALVVAVLVPLTTLADQGQQESLSPMPTLTMSEAVKAAEQAVSGQALVAQFGSYDGQPSYEVDIMREDNTTHTVLIDATDGRLTIQPQPQGQGMDTSGVIPSR